ncbi:MAG: SPFH domain-containing protein [Paenibacillus macerans]|uniref:SPFH domain / Band 7 family protein n=1 Tax=Paenibacillus macerans TaxID=44252 RepID=A0A090ZML5_PAEMA|nr:SPFH domain-containing protein [Paenibacillus macerans]KFN11643.1 SPFH domain / Band 7 family protein [Paenibacillus macerans]MBS5913741.1 SPFH/Band 7/PHB domain protein [Paenibacillus macerans]MCY7560019.1 SPFH/Band 7/PHB domain protein [Paenibacillus macerans]MDU5948317.1 SPFH domain-containing protein [Paenibacillus macerans]MDU7474196.1 SPFH domain-containing protein [Paenibacillus macerans]
MPWVILVIIVVVVVVFISLTIKIVPQQRVGVVERLGKFHRLLTPGLNILIPVIDQVRLYHDLRIQQTNVPPQTVITKDNVQVEIDTIIFYQVVDPEQATYGISDYVYGVRNITTATMRQIIGKLELDETLSGREKISTEIRIALDEATEKWGVRIERVEVIDIKPPIDIQEAMDKQMKAERNKRAIVLEAEAAKQDMILRAEGDKQSKILKAEGDKEARIREAEGLRQAQELEALGEAKAIQAVAEAEKARIEMLRDAALTEEVLAYQSFDALKEVAKGPANKVFIPSNAIETLGSLGAIGEVFKSGKEGK